jgi:phosphoribosyl 1,2-cyclic phosphate phosphodiesterase
MTLTATILGCGSSTGVPRVGLGWGDADPNNPKNRRRRCSLLVERRNAAGRTCVLVDTSPDLREQLLDAEVEWLDAVLYTHEHADHTHGIDDLRPLTLKRRRRIDVYADVPTARALNARFGYCFVTPAGSEYPPIVTEHPLEAGRPVTITGDGGTIVALPFLQVHGDMGSLGFRFGNLAYSADVSAIAPESLPLLEGLDLWILDALRYRPHPSHFSLADALRWIEQVKPKRAILTNMHSDLDYERLRRELPPHVEPAHDGLRLAVSETPTGGFD